jgi:hypothetical protein
MFPFCNCSIRINGSIYRYGSIYEIWLEFNWITKSGIHNLSPKSQLKWIWTGQKNRSRKFTSLPLILLAVLEQFSISNLSAHNKFRSSQLISHLHSFGSALLLGKEKSKQIESCLCANWIQQYSSLIHILCLYTPSSKLWKYTTAGYGAYISRER